MESEIYKTFMISNSFTLLSVILCCLIIGIIVGCVITAVVQLFSLVKNNEYRKIINTRRLTDIVAKGKISVFENNIMQYKIKIAAKQTVGRHKNKIKNIIGTMHVDKNFFETIKVNDHITLIDTEYYVEVL